MSNFKILQHTPIEFSHLSLGNLNIYVHLNILSLSYYIDELNLLLPEMVNKPKIIAIISESKIRNKEQGNFISN